MSNQLVSVISDFHYNQKIHWKSLKDLKHFGQAWVDSITKKFPELADEAKDVFHNEIAYRASISGTSNLLDIQDNVLIMKGGGIKGLSYVGALEIIDKYYDFNWYSGTSAGAITAVLLASGHNVNDLKIILSEKNFNDFKDAGLLRRIYNLCAHRGLYKADTFVKWLDELLATKLNFQYRVKLSDLPSRVTIYASRKNSPALIFDSAKPDSRNQAAAYAARCSMSIPIIFTPQRSEGLNVFDGGLQNNFPVEILLKDNPDANFIGFYLGDATYKWKKNSIINDITNITLKGGDEDVVRRFSDSIVTIDTNPIDLLNFKLSEIEKTFLLESGRLAAIDFIMNKGFVIDEADLNSFDERKNVHNNNRLILQQNYAAKKRKTRLIFMLTLVIISMLFYFYL